MTKAAAGAPASYTYYRLSITARNGGDRASSVEFALRETIGGASVAPGSGGTASASSDPASFGRSVNNLFNGSTDDPGWFTVTSPAEPVTVTYQFTTARTIVQYGVGAHDSGVVNATHALNSWNFQGSNDGSAWDTLHTVSGEASWTAGELRVFTL